MFTIFSLKLAGDSDPTRISANIVSGVGFLGAGVILREGGRVIGLRIRSHRQVKMGSDMILSWQAGGSPQAHERLREKLFADEEVKEFRF